MAIEIGLMGESCFMIIKTRWLKYNYLSETVEIYLFKRTI